GLVRRKVNGLFGWKSTSSKKKAKSKDLLTPRQVAGLFDKSLIPAIVFPPAALNQSETQDHDLLSSMRGALYDS
ncbi:unnamed protein product, partial [Hapterophycus canaliculatus]